MVRLEILLFFTIDVKLFHVSIMNIMFMGWIYRIVVIRTFITNTIY